MKRTTFLAAWTVAIAVFLTACAGPDPGDDILRRGNVEAPKTLDPALADEIHTFNILIDLYEGLMAEDASGRLIPGAAESWSISEDGKVYEFQLRPDARWSNGEHVSAYDFVRGLRRVAAPSTLSPYADLLVPIENFSAVKSGSLPVEQLGISAESAHTLIIRLASPSAHFLGLLAMPVAFPLFGDGNGQAQFEDPREIVGNGAYELAHNPVGGPTILRRNENYWNADGVSIETIEYIAIVDESSEYNMFRTGELDITASIPPAQIRNAVTTRAEEIHIGPSLALYYLAFDLTEPPLDNQDLRAALSMAIDREQLVALLGRGEQPAYAVVPPGVANYAGPEYEWRGHELKRRQQLARDFYSQAGYDDGNPLTLRLVYDAGGIHEKIALAISAMWRNTLGVTIELDKREWMYFLETRNIRDDWAVMRFSWFGDYNDATTFLNIFVADSEQNLPRYSNEEYDNLIHAASQQVDARSRAVLLASAEQELIDDYPIAPLYFYVSKHMVKSTIGGFENNVLDRHPSRFLYRKD